MVHHSLKHLHYKMIKMTTHHIIYTLAYRHVRIVCKKNACNDIINLSFSQCNILKFIMRHEELSFRSQNYSQSGLKNVSDWRLPKLLLDPAVIEKSPISEYQQHECPGSLFFLKLKQNLHIHIKCYSPLSINYK